VRVCLDCGCNEPDEDHGDDRHITLTSLAAAAMASGGLTIPQAAANIVATVANAETSMDPEIFKSADEQRYVLGIGYMPGRRPEIAKGLDGGRDFFTEAELEKAAFSFLSDGPPEIGIGHVDGTTGCATVVESYVWRGPDWDFGNGITVTKGTWLIGAILDEHSWSLAKAGKLNGFSMQGIARRRRVAKE
jgi:hypothetical protein